MKIDRIVLCNIENIGGDEYTTWIDTTKEKITVCLCRKGRLADYYLATLIDYLLTSDDRDFEIHDGFDGANSDFITRESIRDVVRRALTVVPACIGRINVRAEFEPCDPAVPF